MFYIEHINEAIVLFCFILTINMLNIEHTNQLHCMLSMEYRPLKYNVLIGLVDAIMF